MDRNTTALCDPQTPSSLMPSGSLWGLPVPFADGPRKVKVTSVGVGNAETSKRRNTGSAWKVTSPTSSSPRGEPAFQTLNEIYNSKQVKRERYIRFRRRPVQNLTDIFISWRGTCVPDMIAKCISFTQTYTCSHKYTHNNACQHTHTHTRSCPEVTLSG